MPSPLPCPATALPLPQPPHSPVGLGGGGALNQVVAVDGGGHSGLGQAGGNELQHRHLSGGILHGHAVCREPGVRGLLRGGLN